MSVDGFVFVGDDVLMAVSPTASTENLELTWCSQHRLALNIALPFWPWPELSPT